MLDTIVELAVLLKGGLWKLKKEINESHQGVYRNVTMRLYYLYLRNCGSYIGHSAMFDGTPFFPHGIKGIFIAGGSRIGKNSVIFHHVTIGSNPLPNSNTTGFPIIGERCYLGTGATVIGGVRIGNNCRIGANCTVCSDIPDNSTVVSQAPRIIQREMNNNRHFKWSREGPVYYEDGRWYLEKDSEIIEILRNKL